MLKTSRTYLMVDACHREIVLHIPYLISHKLQYAQDLTYENMKYKTKMQ